MHRGLLRAVVARRPEAKNLRGRRSAGWREVAQGGAGWREVARRVDRDVECDESDVMIVTEEANSAEVEGEKHGIAQKCPIARITLS